MRWLVWVLLVGCHATKQHVGTARPATSAIDVGQPAKDGAAIASGGGGAWAASFPPTKNFQAFTVSPASRALITWRVGASRALEALPPEEDYGGNHVSLVELAVDDVRIDLGELPGSPVAVGVSFCKNGGFQIEGEGSWAFPQQPDVASAFTMATMQGSDDFLLVRDGSVLHVLHREASDGHCEAGRQGPLEICEGFEFERIAEVRVGSAELAETIDDGGQPFDCRAAQYGIRLVRP